MQYWIEIDGARDRLLSKEDLCSKYRHLPADTPCAKSGEKTWRKLTDYFPDWPNTIVEQSDEPDTGKTAAAPSCYPALCVISKIYRILAFIIGSAAIAVALAGVMILVGGNMAGFPLILGGIGGLFGVITCFAIAEAIHLFIDIENNTRNIANNTRNGASPQNDKSETA
jgi:hypothetical protein